MLNKNQKAFCREYIKNGLNGMQAYKKVYGCEDDKAKVSASRLLTNVNVQEYVKELQKELEEKALVTAEEIINEIKSVAFFNIKNIYDNKGELKEVYELDDNISRAISSIKVQQKAGAMKIQLGSDIPLQHIDEQVKEIKTNDKLKALELLGKYIGLFNDKQDIVINNNIDNQYKELSIEELKNLAGG